MFQAKTEVNTLVFARVFKVVLDPPRRTMDHRKRLTTTTTGLHRWKSTTRPTLERQCSSNARRTCPERTLFFGSVPHRLGYTAEGEITHLATWSSGRSVRLRKGLALWWTHRARAFLHFKSLLHNPSKMTNEARTFSMLRRRGLAEDNDDLYWMARVLLKKDVDVLVEQLLPEDQRRRHPSKKDGFQKKRGFDTCFHPVEIAYFLSVFSKDLELYDAFVARLEDHRGTLEDWPDHELRTYSRDRLERNLGL